MFWHSEFYVCGVVRYTNYKAKNKKKYLNQVPICELKHYYTNKEQEIRYNIKCEEKEIST